MKLALTDASIPQAHQWSVVWAILALTVAVTAQSTESRENLILHADAVRRLGAEQASQGYAVKIRGVVTDDVPAPDFFVQDSTAGIYVEGSHFPEFQHHLGDIVEVEGVTGPGKFAPAIRERSFRVLGQGAVPEGRLHAFSELADAQMDSQWVKVRGIIRSASIDRTSWREMVLALRVDNSGLWPTILGYPARCAPLRFPD